MVHLRQCPACPECRMVRALPFDGPDALLRGWIQVMAIRVETGRCAGMGGSRPLGADIHPTC